MLYYTDTVSGQSKKYFKFQSKMHATNTSTSNFTIKTLLNLNLEIIGREISQYLKAHNTFSMT